MKTEQRPSDQFAAATDALLRGELLDAATATSLPELELVRGLRAAAAAGIPDPSFVNGLRQELRLRAATVAAGSRQRATVPAAVHYATLETPVGTLGLAYRDALVVYCSRIPEAAGSSLPSVAGSRQSEVAGPTADCLLPTALAPFEREVAQALGAWPERDDALPPSLERAVRDHLGGKRRFTAVDLSWLTPFQQRVLEKTAEIPRGEVRPYGWIAREIGSPGAVRAVGTALGHNPIPFLIPCHRVVRSDGSLGEYSGGGPAMKERVLKLEGAPVAGLLDGHERYRGSRTTQIVCYPSCHAARRIRPENAVPFASLARAQASGYRPCQLCRPG